MLSLMMEGDLIFRPALGEIMDEHLYDDLMEDIKKVSFTVYGVIDTEKCFIRKSGMKYHVDLHGTVRCGYYRKRRAQDSTPS